MALFKKSVPKKLPKSNLLKAYQMLLATTVEVQEILSQVRNDIQLTDITETRRLLLQLASKITLVLKLEKEPDKAWPVLNECPDIIKKLKKKMALLLSVPSIDQRRMQNMINKINKISELV